MSLPDWIVDERVEFVSPVPVVWKSLEVYDKNLRQFPEVELLGGLQMFLTCRTIPTVNDSMTHRDNTYSQWQNDS